jgi:hypothetical protein
MRKFLACLAVGAFLSLLASCNVAENQEATHYISILAPDTLRTFDTVVVVTMAAGTDSVLDTLWNAPVREVSELAKLRAEHYLGGPVDVLILGLRDGWASYGLKVEIRGSGQPRIDSAPAWDNQPPRISLKGKDSLTFLEGQSIVDTGAICLDDHIGTPRLTVTGKLDSSRAGAYDLEYACRDRAGNVSRRTQYVAIKQWPDTLAPVLQHPSDSLRLAAGAAFADTGFACRDDRDTGLVPIRSGSLDTRSPGDFNLGYRCADSSGNRSPEWTWHVRVLPWPDTLAPELSLVGPESLTVIEGLAWSDPGATCLDARDGNLPAAIAGAVDANKRGEYLLSYVCADSAGNHSPTRKRIVRVARAPDSVRPVLTLKGPDSAATFDHEAYADSGAACRDDRDGPLAVSMEGQVDTSVRGRYVLRFHCADSMGNASEAQRVVQVVRRPDAIAPVLSLRGPDTLETFDHRPFSDPGAACQDDRDGILSVIVTGKVDTLVRGAYPITYRCSDSAKNSAEKIRMVLVQRMPDSVMPMITLRGPDSLVAWEGWPYIDSGATCLDDRDGNIPVAVVGTIDVRLRGTQVLRFHCEDSAGNAAEAQRSVRVVRHPDAIAPVLSLRGPDSLVIFDHRPFSDPGADCQDDRDGTLSVIVTGAVDTLLRGRYPITYRCADSAGNPAEKIRVVLVQRMPDTVKPAITLRGPDSLDAWEGRPYVDSGATCQDERDGTLPVAVAGEIDVHVRGIQLLRFHCADSAGNAAPERLRKVNVIRVPDYLKPVIALIGSAALSIPKGFAYADSGATCQDDRDGNLPVGRSGGVDSSRPGAYALKFGCADSAGNAADTVTRMVTVRPSADSVKPLIALRGPDSIPVVALAYFDDPGANCIDDKDGPIPAAFAGFDPPTGAADGIYRARYTCTDKAGNAAEAFRVVKAGLYAPNITVTQDVSIDTFFNSTNQGYTGMLAMSIPWDQYYSLFKFDLSKVDKAGLKSAKIRFVTWARGYSLNWPGTAQDYSLKVWAVKRRWTEGTGNWFFFDGSWENGGQDWFNDYFLPAWAKNNSTNPALNTGVTGDDKDLVQSQNVSLIAAQTVQVRYDATYAMSKSMAPPKDLRVIEIDVTD